MIPIPVGVKSVILSSAIIIAGKPHLGRREGSDMGKIGAIIASAALAAGILALGGNVGHASCAYGMVDFTCSSGSGYAAPSRPPVPAPPAPAEPEKPTYAGHWEYRWYAIQTGGTNGFVIVYFDLTCIDGECAPTDASAQCWITGYGTGPCAEGANAAIPRNA